MPKNLSLAYFKLKKSLERDVRTFWSIAITSQFTLSVLSEFEQSKKITEVAKKGPPYSYVDLSCEEFGKGLRPAIEFSRENAIVNMVTAFEVYLFEIHSRILMLIKFA